MFAPERNQKFSTCATAQATPENWGKFSIRTFVFGGIMSVKKIPDPFDQVRDGVLVAGARFELTTFGL